MVNQVTTVKLKDLILSENNVRMHPKRQIEEYKRSLEMFGQTKNAVIDEADNVLIGNGLVMAAREPEWDEIYAIRRTDLSENAKLKLMVSDNKIFGLGVDNLDVIDEIFDKLKGDLNIPGYDEDTLNLMVSEAEQVSDEIYNYGVLTDEQTDDIRNRASYTNATGCTNAINSEATADGNSGFSHAEPQNTSKINIECPECEAEIWLLKEQLRQLLY